MGYDPVRENSRQSVSGALMAAVVTFRGWTRKIREYAGAGIATSLPLRQWSAALHPSGVAVILAMFVAVSGAFGTERITADVRYPVIAGLALLILGIEFATRAVFERIAKSGRKPLWAMVRMLAFLTCTIIACWGVARFFEGARGTPPMSRFVVPVLVVFFAAAALGQLSKRSRAPAKMPQPMRPAFVDRLPRALQGAEIVAIEGEDHYVRVHTSMGRHLLLMRFADALRELKRLEGLQTHRSWWVAKSAVTGVKRGNGRATLKLANGLEAPVSRRFAQSLRSKGWY